jgi:hypothetical protein
MLLLGAVAVAVRQVGGYLGIEVLDVVSLVIILGAALLVSGAVLVTSIRELRAETPGAETATAD